MNETIPDKEAYQTNRLGMCWAALGMMIAMPPAMLLTNACVQHSARPIVMAVGHA